MRAFTAGGPGPVPRLLYRTSIGVLVVSTAVQLAGAWTIGVSWDEPYHVERWRNFAAHGWYVIDAQSFHGKPLAGVTDQYVYGPATMAFLHVWNMLFGVDSPGSVSTTAHGYLTRHLGIAFLGLLALVGMAVLGRLVLRRWDWGVVAAACLASVPMWTGHAMYNLKDVPVGTAYIWLTVGLCLLARHEAGSPRLRLGTIVVVGAGSFLMVGTRPGMWTALFCSVVALLVATGLREHQAGAGVTASRWRLVDLGIGLGLGYAGLVALYPHVFLHPLHTAHTSAVASSQFLDVQSSRGFTPLHVILQMPSLLLGFVLIGMAAALLRMRRTIRRVDVTQVRLSLVGVQLLALPVVTMIRPSPLYGDLRQLLFAAPAAALFAAVAMAALVERARRGIDRVRPELFAGVAAVALVVPVLAQLPLFPYSYTYYNGLIDVTGYHPSTEYYRSSGRALVPALPPSGRVVCSPLGTRNGAAMRLSHLDGARDCRTSLISPITAFADKARGHQPPLGPDQFWLITFTPGPAPPNCVTFDRITRRGLFGTKQLSLLARCTAPFPVLTSTEARFDSRITRLWGVFDEGWYLPAFSPGGAGLRIFGDGGSLGFRMPHPDSRQFVEIRTVDPVDLTGLKLLVDGVAVTPYPLPDHRSGLRFVVAPTPGTHHLRILPIKGELSLVVAGIRVTPAPVPV